VGAVKINIIGASGSGATTLAKQLAEHINAISFDVDNYYWKKSDPPFTQRNTLHDVKQLLCKDLDSTPSWVLSGSVMGFAEEIASQFSHVIFLQLDQSIRMDRLAKREYAKYGQRILEGGDMFSSHEEFMQWASNYDNDATEIKSRKIHEEWFSKIRCPVIRLDSQNPLADLLKELRLRL
jgi:adenylate kinase family enzyme